MLLPCFRYLRIEEYAVLPAPVTLLANNYPIMVDARPNIKTLTWPADPFDLAHFDYNTTGEGSYVKRQLIF